MPDNLTPYDRVLIEQIRAGKWTVQAIADAIHADGKEVAMRIAKLRRDGAIGSDHRGRLYVQERL